MNNAKVYMLYQVYIDDTCVYVHCICVEFWHHVYFYIWPVVFTFIFYLSIGFF